MTQNRTPNAASPHKQLDQVLLLFRLVGGLDIWVDFESSFKAVHGRLLTDRFLLGVDRRVGVRSLDESIISICRTIGMPADYLLSFEQCIADANHVYFGVENDASSLLLKVYLEYRDRAECTMRGAGEVSNPLRLFTGFKWSTSPPARQAITDYDWYPSLTVAAMHARVGALVASAGHEELITLFDVVTQLATQRVAVRDIQFLEVVESGNPRRSFDINVYKSGLRLADLYPWLLNTLHRYAIPAALVDSFHQRIKGQRLGHLAGGINRDGGSFLTVYYGAQRVHGSQLASACAMER